MVDRPFDFRGLRRPKRFTPAWFTTYWGVDDASRRYWEEQYRLAKQGKDYRLPDERVPTTPNAQLHRALSEQLWNEIPKDFHSVLDVGCADAYMLRVFQEAGKRAVGIDIVLYPTDRLFIEEHGLTVLQMDMHAMDFRDGSFDAVWCRHSLEHSFAPLQVLVETYRVLRPGGYLFVALPPPPYPQEPYPGHWHQIPEYQLRYLLELCSFEVLTLQTVLHSQFRPNDNSEIRAVARKTALPRVRVPLAKRLWWAAIGVARRARWQ